MPPCVNWINALVVTDPVLCMHGMGKNIKHYGADHVARATAAI